MCADIITEPHEPEKTPVKEKHPEPTPSKAHEPEKTPVKEKHPEPTPAKPAEKPQPKPVQKGEDKKNDEHKVYTFGEEISLKCEGGKVVVKGKAY